MKCRGENSLCEDFAPNMADEFHDNFDVNSDRSDSPACGSQEYYDRGHGHFFVKKTFHKPTYCHHCTDMLWGLIQQGLVCEVCNFVVHDKCLKTVVSPCSSIATTLIKNPVAHCWSEPGQFKRKFCNVCRKRLEDSAAIRCEICEYYAHLDCQDFVVSDCKECATYGPQKDLLNIVHYHHWREGNLPANSKCLACKKTCWSSECLAGMRCEWCGVTAHPGCYRLLPAECNFGSLREIMLPPSCLTMPRMDLSVETMMGMAKRTTRTISEDWSSSGDSKNEEEEKERRSPRDKESKDRDKDTESELIRVFDGNASMKKRLYRTISVPKNAPAQALLEAALKTFHISDDPKNYYVSEASEFDLFVGEKELEGETPIRSQLKTPDGKRPSIFLRYKDKDPDRGVIKVYPGGLKVASGHKNITITSTTTAEDVIRTALKKFGIQDLDPSRFSLIEVLLDRGVSERVLERDEKPWKLIQQSRKESLRQNQMTRYYLQQREDPHGPSISLFVGNLPTGLSQRQYEKILLDIVGKGNKWNGFDVIYYEYGALVLDYTTSEKATRVFNILKDAMFDDKQLLVLLLPNIQPQMIPENVNPLLVFVNVKSGGCQGLNLITSFRKLLNPHQVFNLENGGPLPGLYVFRNVPYYKILACGGDGTVGWVLSCLDNVGQDAICQSPPMSILPLGTGNDLARVLRWGPGYTGGEDPLNYLRDVIDAEDIKLDRWTVIFHPNEKEQDETKVAIANDTNSANTNEDTTTIFVMNNYFGIGIDADISLDFHQAREEKPDKFNSRWTVIFHPNEKEQDETKVAIANDTMSANTNEDTTNIFVMNNYFGIGIDADISLDFHQAREEKPHKFNTRLHNKKVYVQMSLRKMVNKHTCKDLHRCIRLEVDGKLVDLPPVEGIIILNILSWGSGANPWGPEKEDQFQKPTHYDGNLEVVGITGVVHMAQIHSGLRTGIRVAQGGHLRITLLTDLPVQVDGEPWVQPAGQVVVLRSALKATMLKKSKNKIRRRNTEPSIFFPENDNLKAQSPSEESSGGPL